jgi:hypothetical protein
MKHSIALTLGLISCLTSKVSAKNAAAAVFSEEDANDEASFTQVVLTLPGAVVEADTKRAIAVGIPNWQAIAKNNDMAALNKAIAQGQVNVLWQSYHALIWAVVNNNLDMLRKLLAAGAHPNIALDRQHTPLGKCIERLTSERLSDETKKIIKTMIFELLNAGAKNIYLCYKTPDCVAYQNGMPCTLSVASATAFHRNLFDIGALILEHGANGQERYWFSRSTPDGLTLTDLAALNDDAQRHYAQAAVRAGSRGRMARNECLELYEKNASAALKDALLTEIIRIVFQYNPPSCPHIHFTAFAKNLDCRLVAADEWRRQKPTSTPVLIESEISGYRKDSKPQAAPSDAPAQGCSCKVS